MGLKEKRWIKDLKEEIIPTVTKDIKESTGVEIEWDVDWDSFKTVAALENLYDQGLRKVFLALDRIGYDDLGKEALQESLQKVSFINHEDTSKAGIEYRDGTLIINGAWAHSWDGWPTEQGITDALEPNL